jgi:hypothetical protein
MYSLVRVQFLFELFPKGVKAIVFRQTVHCSHVRNCTFVAGIQCPQCRDTTCVVARINVATGDELPHRLCCSHATDEVGVDYGPQVYSHDGTSVLHLLASSKITYDYGGHALSLLHEHYVALWVESYTRNE